MGITVHGNYATSVYCYSFQHFFGNSLRNGSYSEDRIRARDFNTFKRLMKRKRIRDFAISKVESVSRNINPEDTSHNHSGKGGPSSVTSLQSLAETVSNNKLRELVTKGKLYQGLKFLESMEFRGHNPDISMCTSLIRGFCRRGKTREAIRVLEVVEGSGAVLDVVTYNHLISRYCKDGEIDNALQVFDRMGVAPDIFTYTNLIEATCKVSGVEQAMELLDEMRSRGCKPNVVTCSVLVKGICIEGRFNDAIEFVNDMPAVYGCQPNVITYSTILHGLCRACRWKEAERLIADMLRKGFSPDSVMYNTVIDGLSKAGKTEEAGKLLDEMRLQPNIITYSSLVHGLCLAGIFTFSCCWRFFNPILLCILVAGGAAAYVQSRYRSKKHDSFGRFNGIRDNEEQGVTNKNNVKRGGLRSRLYLKLETSSSLTDLLDQDFIIMSNQIC